MQDVELYRVIGRLEAYSKDMADRIAKMDTLHQVIADRMAEGVVERDALQRQIYGMNDSLAAALQEMRRHNKLVHGRYDWRVVGGVTSGAAVVVVALAELVVWLLKRVAIP